MFIKTTEELSMKNSKLHDAVKGKSILGMNYSLLGIVAPNVLDSLMDEITYNRRIGICWDIHERFLFLFICIIGPCIFIAFNGVETMPFLYVALEQSIVVSLFVIVNSMLTKLEKNKILAMIFSVATCIVEGTGSVYKVYGQFDTYYQDIGIKLSFIGTIFQFLIVMYWIHEIVSPKLRYIGSWNFNALMSLSLSSIEKTICFYFLLFLLIILGLVISNAVTDGETWRGTTEENLIAMGFCQLILFSLAVTIPSRWFRSKHIKYFEELVESERNEILGKSRSSSNEVKNSAKKHSVKKVIRQILVLFSMSI